MGTNHETWIIYKAESDAHGWFERRLIPNGGLTDIIAEEWDYSGRPPKVGDRVREYANLEDPGNGVTHGRDGDWVVSRIAEFASPNTNDRIIVCHCDYSPIESQWEELHRGAPVNALLAEDENERRYWEQYQDQMLEELTQRAEEYEKANS